MAAFTITSAIPGTRLGVARQGELSFTVTNTAHRPLEARARVVTEGSADAGWFTIAEAQRDAPADATQQFGVRIAVPSAAAPGTYRFRLDVVAVEDPDEFAGEGPWTTLDVPPLPPPRKLPWPWIAAAVVGVLLLAVVVYLVFIRKPDEGQFRVIAGVQSFGTVQVGQGSAGGIFTIINTGKGSAKATATLAGANPQDFKLLANTCSGAQVPPGSSCQLQVAFQPTSSGARSASLRVETTNAPPPPPVQLTGTGSGTALIGFTPATVVLTLPTGSPGPATAVALLTIKNNGNGTLRISGVKVDDPVAPFRLLSGCENVALNGGQTCDVAVLFVAPAVTPKVVTAKLLVNDDQPGSPRVVALSGYRGPNVQKTP